MAYRFSNTADKQYEKSWLQFIHKTNEAAKEQGDEPIFMQPTRTGIDPGWEDRYVEEYPDAYVVGPLKNNDDGIRVISRNDRAAKYMRLAAIAIGYPSIPEERNT